VRLKIETMKQSRMHLTTTLVSWFTSSSIRIQLCVVYADATCQEGYSERNGFCIKDVWSGGPTYCEAHEWCDLNGGELINHATLNAIYNTSYIQDNIGTRFWLRETDLPHGTNHGNTTEPCGITRKATGDCFYALIEANKAASILRQWCGYSIVVIDENTLGINAICQAKQPRNTTCSGFVPATIYASFNDDGGYCYGKSDQISKPQCESSCRDNAICVSYYYNAQLQSCYIIQYTDATINLPNNSTAGWEKYNKV